MRWRRVRLIAVVVLLVLLVAWVGLDLWAGRRIDEEVARLEKSYGSLAERSLRSPQKVPAADNRARVARAAAALAVLEEPGRRPDLAPERYLGLRPWSPVPESVRAYVEINRPAIRIAEETRSRGRTSWEADYVSGVGFPPLMELRLLSNAICLAALIDLQDGRADSAAHQVATGLAVASTLREEPVLIVQLVRIAMYMTQLQVIRQIVIGADPSRSTLEDLARWLVESRSPSPIGVGLVGELRLGHAEGTRIEAGRVEDLISDAGNPASWYFGPIARLSRPLVRLAHLRYLREFERLIKIERGPRPRPDIALSQPVAWPGIRRFSDRFSTAGLERALESGDELAQGLSATELAVALRRFRLDAGSYPDDLSALVPKYLPAVPIDPFTGRPLVYARKDAGFELHAEGPKRGSPRSPVLDWVVPK